MSKSRGKKSKARKVLIPVLKWLSAIIPVCVFIYILYYYGQFDFLNDQGEIKSETQVVGATDSLSASAGGRDELAKKIHILKNEWHIVGGIAVHNLVIENTSKSAVKTAEVEFKYLNDVQGVVASKIITVKNPLPANKSTAVSGLSVGYVNNSVVGCDVKVLSVRP